VSRVEVDMSELDWVFTIHNFLEILDKVKVEKFTDESLRALQFDCQYFASKCTISMSEERAKLLQHLARLRNRQELLLAI
jgi:hypothetical protein